MRIPSSMSVVILPFLAALTLSAQQPPSPAAGAAPAAGKLALTVDSIMRGPGLVGYPPSGLRWSGGSRDLYFEWRRPGDEEGGSSACCCIWVRSGSGTFFSQPP